MNKLKLIFIGTPDFALPSLEDLLHDRDFEVAGIITQPDKKSGRRQILTPPPVKLLALKYGLPVWQPEKIRDFEIGVHDLDFVIVAAYAQIIPASILGLPRFGGVNVHGSLLPKYRGASCVAAAILNGDKKSGITIMKMDEHLDAGPILHQAELPIALDETTLSLYEKLSRLGGQALPGVLKKYAAGLIAPRAQDDEKASYVRMFEKDDGRINWIRPAIELERFVRAMHPWPGAWTEIKKDDRLLKVKISAARVIVEESGFQLGEIFAKAGSPAVRCGKDSLLLDSVQPEGKREMSGPEFLRGNAWIIEKNLAVTRFNDTTSR